MIEAVDREIGNLLEGIDAVKMANTMVIVMGDNGTPGDVMDVSIEAAAGLHTPNHGKTKLYEWGIRVPLIVSGPLIAGNPANPIETDALVHAVDIWPTIAAITGASPRRAFEAAGLAEDPAVDGISFLPAILDPTYPGRSFVFCESFTPNYIPGTIPDSNPPGFYPPDDCFKGHTRCVTNGSYKYLSTQQFKSVYPVPIDAVCLTPTVYNPPEFYSLLADREERVQLTNPSECEEVALQWLKDRMRVTSGYD